VIVFSLLPILATGGAAALGYAVAVYPIRQKVNLFRQTETVGTLITDAEGRGALLGAYEKSSGLDTAAFDDVLWSVRTVMTPFVGFAPAPGTQHNAYIDARQFRGRSVLTVPKPPNVTRIFLIGASVAFGAGATSDERTIGGYLQTLLDQRPPEPDRRYEVFTFASPGWSSTHERIAIENRISELEPDLVVTLTGVADCVLSRLGRNVLWSFSFNDHHYWELLNVALERSGFEAMVNVQDSSPQRVPPQTVATRLEKNVRLASAALSLENARLHVFLQPGIPTTAKALSSRERGLRDSFDGVAYHQECYRHIRETLGVAELPANSAFTDLTAVFDGIPETQEVFLDRFHVGDHGNRAIAKAIVDSIG